MKQIIIQIIIILTIIILLIPAVAEQTKNQSICTKQGYSGFAHKENGIHCYRTHPFCPLYIQNMPFTIEKINKVKK